MICLIPSGVEIWVGAAWIRVVIRVVVEAHYCHVAAGVAVASGGRAMVVVLGS